MFGEADGASWNWASPAPVSPCRGRWGQGMQLAHQSLKPVVNSVPTANGTQCDSREHSSAGYQEPVDASETTRSRASHSPDPALGT